METSAQQPRQGQQADEKDDNFRQFAAEKFFH